MRPLPTVAPAIAVVTLPALAHACPAHVHHLAAREVLGWWTFDPWMLALLTLSVSLYARGVSRLWDSAGDGHGIRPREVAAYSAGVATLAFALFSPLDRLSDILFSAHMSQHELLMVVAAPLMVLGRPLLPYLWALPPRARETIGAFLMRPTARGTWRTITGPLFVLFAHGLTLWLWHAPALFEAALADERVHAVQHAMFFGTAALFWWSLTHGRYGRAGYGVGVVYVFATATHSGILGALLTVAARQWYPTHAARSDAWGVDALTDQQLAGLIMWVPAGVVLSLVGLALLAAWIGEAERRAVRDAQAASRVSGAGEGGP